MALNDAMSRVASIAIVHETLSQAFDEIVEFDKVADGLLRMVGDVAASWGGVSAGPAGQLRGGLGRRRDQPGDGDHRALPERRRARPGRLPGQVLVVPTRHDGRLRVEISDDGRGLPPDFDWRQSRSLGLSIVNTLVAEMEGMFRARVPAGRAGNPRRRGDTAVGSTA